MKKLPGLALLSLMAVAGCTEDEGATVNPASVPPAGNNVIVGPNGTISFAPMTITINAGDTVNWSWASGPHTVTSGVPGAPDGKFCSLPAGQAVNAMSCNTTAYATSSGTYSHTFDVAGTYAYYCTIHGAAMTGSVVVNAPSPTPTPDMAVPPGPTPTPTAKTVDVSVGPGGTLSFAPSGVDINAGDTVNWTWASAAIPHTVTSGTAPSADGAFCSNGGAQNAGACAGAGYAKTAPFSFQHTFAAAGTFPYFCEVHGAAMTGVIRVH
jgi:plastocyanin